MKDLKVFPTIDMCVDYLERVLGCIWDNNKEMSLRNKKCFLYKNTLVLYDKYEILSD